MPRVFEILTPKTYDQIRLDMTTYDRKQQLNFLIKLVDKYDNIKNKREKFKALFYNFTFIDEALLDFIQWNAHYWNDKINLIHHISRNICISNTLMYKILLLPNSYYRHKEIFIRHFKGTEDDLIDAQICILKEKNVDLRKEKRIKQKTKNKIKTKIKLIKIINEQT